MSDFEIQVIFLLQVIVLFQACIAGILTVQLYIHSKNQKSLI